MIGKIKHTLFKIVKWILGTILFLFLVLQLPPVQNTIAKKVLDQLHENYNLPIEINKIKITFFNRVKLKQVYLGHNKTDTIVYAKDIAARIRLSKLISGSISFKAIQLNQATIHLIKYQNDSLLNIAKLFQDLPKQNNKQTATQKTPLTVSKLKLNDIQFSYRNESDSAELKINVQKFVVDINRLDLPEKSIELKAIYLKDFYLENYQGKLILNQPDSSGIAYNIGLEKSFTGKNINVQMHQAVTRQTTSIKHIDLELSADDIDLPNKSIHLQHALLEKADVLIEKKSVSKSDPLRIAEYQTKKQTEPFQWTIIADEFELEKTRFRSNQTSESINTQSTLIEDINTQVSAVTIQQNNYAATINSLNFRWNDSIQVDNLTVTLLVNNKSTSVSHARFISGQSTINFNAEAHYPSLNKLGETRNDLGLSLTMDASLFAPDFGYLLPQNMASNNYPKVTVFGKVEGTMARLKIQSLLLEAEDMIWLNLNGSVNHLLDKNNITSHLNIQKLIVKKDRLQHVLPDSIIPSSITLPDSILMKGEFSGNSQRLNTNLSMFTSLGKLQTDLQLIRDSIPDTEFFTSSIQLDSFNLGTFLSNPDTFGIVSLQGHVKGHTKQFKNPVLTTDINVSRMDLLQHPYNQIILQGAYQKKSFEGIVQIKDEYLKLDFNGILNTNDSIPELNFNLHLAEANLKALNFTTDSTNVAGIFHVNLTGNTLNTMHGNAFGDSIFYSSNNRKYQLDSIKVRVKQDADSTQYQLQFYSLFSNDSLWFKKGDLHAQVKDKNLFFNYRLAATKPETDTMDVLIGGTGDMILSNDSLQSTTQLIIRNTLYNRPLSFQVNFRQKAVNKTQQNMLLSAEGSGVNLQANAQISKKNIEATVQVDSLDLGYVTPFTNNQISKLEGHINGQLTVSGSSKSPNINGSIQLHETTIRPSAVNTDFIVKNEKITIANSQLQFNNLSIADPSGNTASLNGHFSIAKTGSNINITLRANDFLLLNKSAASADLYYGKIIADVNADITGSLTHPEVSLNTEFSNESNFVFIVPKSQSKVKEQKEIIEFVDATTEQQNSIPTDSVMYADRPNFELTTNVSLSDKLQITLITDPVSDEKLEFSGDGDLSFTMNKNGTMGLTGNYEIKQGKYKLHLYDVIKREFEIEEGSSLSWSGDVMDARANISAIYNVRTTTLELAKGTNNQLSNDELRAYSEPIEMEVVMRVTGELLSPDIEFKIEVGESYQGSNAASLISGLNNNKSELNKQVISLLVFNSFTGTEMGGANLTYEMENTAKQSLTNLLSEQLNQFSNQYITGVDVSFNIDAYNQKLQEQQTSRTDVGVDLSRNLFNNRLTIEVGGSVAVEEGQGSQENYATNNLAGDFMVEYKITPDGKYRLQAFNKTEFEDDIDGEVTKTGIAFIFNKNFTRFKDLFKEKEK